MHTSTTGLATDGHPTLENEVESSERLVRRLQARLASHCSRPIAGASELSVSELRGDGETGLPEYV